MFEMLSNGIFGTLICVFGVLLAAAVVVIAFLVITSIVATLMEVPIVAICVFPVIGQLCWGTFGVFVGLAVFVILFAIRIKRGQ